MHLHITIVQILLISLFVLFSISYLSGQWITKNGNIKTAAINKILRNISCSELFKWNSSASYQNKMKQVTVDSSHIMQRIRTSADPCLELQNQMQFFDSMSEEERNYSLAYGMLVHKDAFQVYLMLSTVYQPQHQFCIAVDQNSKEAFYQDMLLLQQCHKNIKVMKVGAIQWCGYEILSAVMQCLRYLSSLSTPWKYYQYLSGVDAVLKTNLEMTRIFKALNDNANVLVLPFEHYRLWKKFPQRPPLPMYKTSMSALLPRRVIDFIATNEVVDKLFRYLNGTSCADESVWATSLGNPQHLPAPSGFDARKFIYSKKFGEPAISSHSQETFHIDNYFIARYQQWVTEGPSKCNGKHVRYSCVFGVDDLPILVRRPELVAHKLYMDFQPVAFMCLVKEIRDRTLHPIDFNVSMYENLPGSPHFLT